MYANISKYLDAYRKVDNEHTNLADLGRYEYINTDMYKVK